MTYIIAHVTTAGQKERHKTLVWKKRLGSPLITVHVWEEQTLFGIMTETILMIYML